MNEEILALIYQYIQVHLNDLELNWYDCSFKDFSYAKWTVYELLCQIMDHPFAPAEDVVESFLCLVCIYERKGSLLPFDVIKKTLTDILTFLTHEKEKF